VWHALHERDHSGHAIARLAALNARFEGLPAVFRILRLGRAVYGKAPALQGEPVGFGGSRVYIAHSEPPCRRTAGVDVQRI